MLNAIEIAREAFDAYAGMNAPDLPANDWSALQVRLARWQARNFGGARLEQVALGVAEEIGELAGGIRAFIDARSASEKACAQAEIADAIADTSIYLIQASTLLRLDFGVLTGYVGEMYPWPDEPDRLLRVYSAAGRLCHAALKHSQRIRGFQGDDALRAAAGGAIRDCALQLIPLAKPGTYRPVLFATAEMVMRRDWVANADDAHEVAG